MGKCLGLTKLGVPRARPRGTGDTEHVGVSGLGAGGCGRRPPGEGTHRKPTGSRRTGSLHLAPPPSCAALGPLGNRVLRRPSAAASTPEELHFPQGTGPLLQKPVRRVVLARAPLLFSRTSPPRKRRNSFAKSPELIKEKREKAVGLRLPECSRANSYRRVSGASAPPTGSHGDSFSSNRKCAITRSVVPVHFRSWPEAADRAPRGSWEQVGYPAERQLPSRRETGVARLPVAQLVPSVRERGQAPAPWTGACSPAPAAGTQPFRVPEYRRLGPCLLDGQTSASPRAVSPAVQAPGEETGPVPVQPRDSPFLRQPPPQRPRQSPPSTSSVVSRRSLQVTPRPYSGPRVKRGLLGPSCIPGRPTPACSAEGCGRRGRLAETPGSPNAGLGFLSRISPQGSCQEPSQINPSHAFVALRGQFNIHARPCLPVAHGDVAQHSRQGSSWIQEAARPLSTVVGQAGSPKPCKMGLRPRAIQTEHL